MPFLTYYIIIAFKSDRNIHCNLIKIFIKYTLHAESFCDVDEDGNVTITLLTEVENEDSISGSGIMTSLAALLTEGYTIRIDVKGGSYAEMTAENPLDEIELITLLDLPTVGNKDYTVTITSDIDGYAPVVYNVTVTADIGA